MTENEPADAPQNPQALIETAIVSRIRARQRFVARAAPLGSDAAAEQIASLTSRLHAAYDALNGIFQAHVRNREYAAASRVKDAMDDISLLLVALSDRVIRMYEGDAAAAANTLGEVQRRLHDVTAGVEADASTWGQIGGAVGALASAIGIAT